MVDEIRILHFLEDIAQEYFVKSIVTKVAKEVSEEIYLTHDIRNASGGKGRVEQELRGFLKDLERRLDPSGDVLIVAIDGNCKGRTKKKKELEEDIFKGREIAPLVVCAIPESHIERWYLLDEQALSKALGFTEILSIEPKCERSYYKNKLKKAVIEGRGSAPLGGAECAEDIVAYLNLYRACQKDNSFKHFVDDLKAQLRQAVRIKKGTE